MMGDIIGVVFVKDKLTRTDCLCCNPEDIINQKVSVLEVAVDNSSYLCYAKRNNEVIGLVDIHKDDVIKFVPFDKSLTDPYSQLLSMFSKINRSL